MHKWTKQILPIAQNATYYDETATNFLGGLIDMDLLQFQTKVGPVQIKCSYLAGPVHQPVCLTQQGLVYKYMPLWERLKYIEISN